MAEAAPMIGQHESGPAAVWRLVRDRNYAPYLVGNFVSASGMWLQTVAQSILVYRLTDSAVLLGLVNFAQFAGVIAVAPWAGPAADRFDRRHMLMGAQLLAAVFAAALALLVATGTENVALVIALVLGTGFGIGVATPAMHALLPGLVPPARLPVAIAFNSATYNLARAVGPAVGALTVAHTGIAFALAVTAVAYGALPAGLLFVRAARRSVSAARPRLFDSIVVLRRAPKLLGLLGIVMIASVTVDPVTTLGPLFATDVFDRPDTSAGWLLAAVGAGAVAAAFFVAGRPVRSPSAMAARMALMGVGMLGFANAPGFGLALAALVVAGVGFLSTNAAATTRLQLELDDEHRGRIMALWGVAFIGSRPVASLVDGFLADGLGVHAAATIMSAPALAGAAVLTGLALRGSRTARPQSTDYPT